MSEIKKIVIIGPESTGKSSLSEALAKSLNTVWVPEYARAYLENLGRGYIETDLLEIGKGQIALENQKIAHANRYLICDTDLNVLKVWSEAKYKRCYPWILEQIATRQYDLYLLTNIDVPWQNDPLREHPDPKEREYFYNVYRDIVIHSGIPWIDISGDSKQRFDSATKAVFQLL